MLFIFSNCSTPHQVAWECNSFNMSPYSITITAITFTKLNTDSLFIVRGRLVDAVSIPDSLLSLDGAFIKNKRTNVDTFSDTNGLFKLENVVLADTIEFNVLGYEKREILIRDLFHY